MQQLSEYLNCAIVLVHHMTKPTKDKEGRYFERSDKDSFGSAFLSAGVDHIFWMEKAKDGAKNEKVLRCDTQRSGSIIDSIRIKLNVHDPLYFEFVNKYIEEGNKLVKVLHKHENGMTMEMMLKCMPFIKSKTTLYKVLSDLSYKHRIVKIGTKPKFYKLVDYINMEIEDEKLAHPILVGNKE
jgi:hypothetical protein